MSKEAPAGYPIVVRSGRSFWAALEVNMARRRSQSRRRPLVLAVLLVSNMAVLALVWTVWGLRDPVGEPAAPVPVVDRGKPVDWSAFAHPEAVPGGRCADCNVLVLSLDIFRPDRLPCFGGPHDTGTAICGLAKHSVLFNQFIVQAYQTPIAQMAMFAGRYPSRTGFSRFSAVLPADEAVVPEVFAASGYETVAMGSSFEVMTDMSSWSSHGHTFTEDGLNPGLSFGRGFERFVYTGYRNLPTDAIPFVRDRPADAPPYFLWVAFGTLHWPYGASAHPSERQRFDPPGYDGRFVGLDAPHFPLVSRIYKGTWYSGSGPVPLTEDDLNWIRARYDVGLLEVDRFVGELLSAIPPEQAARTLVVLHGIHGEDLGEHGYFGHYDVFDTEVHQRLMVLNPMQTEGPAVVEEVVEGVDLAPTLADLVGLSMPVPPEGKPLDGVSLRETMMRGAGDPERMAISERIPLWEDIFRHLSTMPPGYVERIRPLLDGPAVGDLSVRTRRWKLIHRRVRELEAEVSWWTEVTGAPLQRDALELYDLQSDPTELRDVKDAHPDVVARLWGHLQTVEQDLDLPPVPGSP